MKLDRGTATGREARRREKKESGARGGTVPSESEKERWMQRMKKWGDKARMEGKINIQ
jgi:hypothetical protein